MQKKLLYPLITAVAVMLILGNSSLGGFLTGVGYKFVKPLAGGTGMAGKGLRGFSGLFANKRFLLARNIELQRENEALIQAMAMYQESWRENERLHRLLDMPLPSLSRRTVARIVGMDAGILHIDKGSRHGIEVDQIVVSSEGTVGRVIRVFSSEARVLSVSSLQSNVGALLADSRQPGVMRGNGHGGADLLYIPVECRVAEGEKISTSGLGGIYPAGLYLGTVTKIVEDKHSMTKRVGIRLGAHSSLLEEVMVIGAG